MFSFLRRAPVIEIEPLRSSQAAECARLHATSFAHPWSSTEIESLSASESVLADAAIAKDSKKIAGFVMSRQAADEAEILTIVVDPTLRGHRIGLRLLEAHFETLARGKAKIVFLEVDESNGPARNLYNRQGFMVVGRREAYYRNRDSSATAALVMRKALK